MQAAQHSPAIVPTPPLQQNQQNQQTLDFEQLSMPVLLFPTVAALAFPDPKWQNSILPMHLRSLKLSLYSTIPHFIIKISFLSFSNKEHSLVMTSQDFLCGFIGLESSTLGIAELQHVQTLSRLELIKKT